jgi:GABA permease
VIANETAASSTLLDTLRERAAGDDVSVTVIAPVSEPRQGYVVYDDTRRASARRRLDKTLGLLRASSIPAQGFVVECSPVQAAKDALAQLEPPPDEIVVSTHVPQRSGWLRRNVVRDIERAAAGLPVTHVVAEDEAVAEKNVLVLANETVLSTALLDRIRDRVARGPASFLIVAPQSDDSPAPEAERRLRRVVSELQKEGIDAHGQVVHPDPFTAAMHATHDERVDEIIVSTFSGQRPSSWLRGDLIQRLQRETGLPVDHVEAG